MLKERVESTTLVCAACQSPVAEKKYLFSVPGAEGEMGAYVDPHGYRWCLLTCNIL